MASVDLRRLPSIPPCANDQRPSDPRVERAATAMAGALAERWSVRRAAKTAGMSRAAFARRFEELLGAPPLRWLSGRRMERAAELLQQGDDRLARVAEKVGYTSEFAFSRAFKRHFGVAPGLYRRVGATPPVLARAA